MDTMIHELIQILSNESKIYEDILNISKNKTSIIVEGKVNELEKIVKLEQSLVLQIAKLESQRETLIYKISKAMGVKPGELTISELIKKVGREYAEKLKFTQETLAKTIKEIGTNNEVNSKLIKNSLEYINFSLNIVANVGNSDNNYGVDAEKNSGKTKNFFDLKI
ncbi:MAG: flagellar protein FlgN [Clostridia bacterium]|nr:flagellar protein FlgN [Clostridia bacterium]